MYECKTKMLRNYEYEQCFKEKLIYALELSADAFNAEKFSKKLLKPRILRAAIRQRYDGENDERLSYIISLYCIHTYIMCVDNFYILDPCSRFLR